jgi:hypothetical protein
MAEIFDNALDAWKYLVEHGGLEVADRDAAFLEQLIQNLTGIQPEDDSDMHSPVQALNINDLLKDVSVERLVNAMFVCMGLPFIRMMKDLLDHFSRAEITEGPSQWRLLLTSETDHLEVDLEDFKKWIKSALTPSSPLMVPILRPGVSDWDVFSAFSDEREERGTIGQRSLVNHTDSRQWLSSHESAAWLPLPPVIQRMLQRTDHLRDVAALVSEMASALESIVPNYQALSDRRFELVRTAPEELRPHIPTEHDRWIESMVKNLAALEVADADEQTKILAKLTSLLDNAELQPSQYAHSIDDLTTFLDLPIWKKRYELYSAWLLTQFLAAMKGHSITYHDEDGKLTFGFHATKFATIASTTPPIQITGERRIAATDVWGHGRKQGIQPDYTVWTVDSDRCVLAIECKHYKKGSYKNFHDALRDYAANLPEAQVFLGNYGPIPILINAETRNGGMSGRQFAWGNLNPDYPTVTTSFRGAVRKLFGEPPLTALLQHGKGLSYVLGIDVSPSMHDLLRNTEVRQAIARIVAELAITHFAAVDDHLMALDVADVQRIDFFIAQSNASGTNLETSIQSLSEIASTLYFLTDADGLRSLGDAAVEMQQYMTGFPELRGRGVTLARV